MNIPPLPAIPIPTFNPPTPSFTDLHGSTNVLINLLGREAPKCADIPRYRTITNIVVSCLTTIFTCTWVALHHDVPKSHKSIWKSFWWKFRRMIVALMIPEYIVATAWEEWANAKKNRDVWNANFVSLCDPKSVTIRGKTSEQYARELKDKEYDSRWTLTHGFLASMGGITLYDVGDKDLQNFSPEIQFTEDPKMLSIIQQIGLISCDDIQDKSKGDGLTKFLVVSQATWFIVQCLARWTTHLPVTELEVVTLAYAVQNIFIYILWWNKPQSLSVPFRLYVEKDAEQLPETLSVNGASEQEVPLSLPSQGENTVHERPDLPALPLPGPHRRGQRWFNPKLEGAQANRLVSWFRDFKEKLFFGHIYYALSFSLAGCIFGALHLIPLWSKRFASTPEYMVWAFSASAAAKAPLDFVTAIRNGGTLPSWVLNYCFPLDTDDDGELLREIELAAIAASYAVPRVILLVLAFTTLRWLPREAFQSVEWTTFIPHF